MTHRLRAAALLLLTLSLPSAAWALPEVFVEPLSLYNTPDLDDLAQGLRSMLASRLEGSGYVVRAQGNPPQGQRDWLVRTSITRLGSTYSLDSALISVGGAGEGARTYQTADNPDALVPALGQVAEQLRKELRFPVAAVPAAPSALAATPTTGATDLQSALQRQRAGPEIQGEALSIVVADADDDGNLEVLVLTEGSITAFRDRDRELVQAWESPAPREFTPTTLSAGDLDGNGVPELFVAGIRNHSPVTQALEWFGSALAPKGDRALAFLRAIPHPEQGVLLLGMARGSGRDLFDFGMRRYSWEGSRYREVGRYPITERAIGVNVDFLRFGTEQQVFAVITTQADVVQGLDEDGQTVFEIDDKVKGTRGKLRGLEQTAGMQDEDIVQIAARTVGYHAPSGEDYLLVHKNAGGMGRLFDRIAGFSNGRLLAFRWDGFGLSNIAQSPKYSGFVADIGIAPAADGNGATLFAALVREKAGLNKTQTTRLVAYDLP